MTHTVVVDLGFGDAGKGTIVDWLCATTTVRTVVRFNGGAQAAHNVVTPDGAHHTFAQFGSGTLHGVPTHLSRFMLVEPLSLVREAAHLRQLGVPDPLRLLTLDRRALLTTPYHAAANRARELARGAARHGSCGMGIGETAAWALAHPEDAPTVADSENPARLRRLLTALADAVREEHAGHLTSGDLPAVEAVVDAYAAFAAAVHIVDDAHLPDLLRGGDVVFEGAQGVLLDEGHGFHPHTTWSTTTARNALALLDEAGQSGRARTLGVVRTFTTRHGAGPLVTEDPGLSGVLAEPHNGTGPWQGAFRVGHFDAVAHRYALAATGGVDAVALTHVDAADGCDRLQLVPGYRRDDGELFADLPARRVPDRDHQVALTSLLARCAPAGAYRPDSDQWPAAVADALRVPVAVVSAGPTWRDKTVRSRRSVAA